MRPAPSACSRCDPSGLPNQRALTDHAISPVDDKDGGARDWATLRVFCLFTERRGVTEDALPPSQSERTEIKNTYVLYDDRGHIIYLYMKQCIY